MNQEQYVPLKQQKDLLQKREHAHKDMAGNKIVEQSELNNWMELNNFSINFDPAKSGGFIWDKESEGDFVGYIRHPYWRQEKNNPNILESDIQPIEPIQEKSKYYRNVKTGFEIEIYGINQDEKSDEIMAVLFENGNELDKNISSANGEYAVVDFDAKYRTLPSDLKEIRFGKEMAKYTVEVNGHPTNNPIKGGLSFLRNQQVLAEIFEDKGWYMSPISAFPHRPLLASDISNDNYLQRIVLNNEKWPKEKSLLYVGNSAQFHTEIINEEAGLKALNLYQLVYPLTLGISLASPFMHGKINPNMKEILVDKGGLKHDSKIDPIPELDKNGVLSVRESTRFLAGIESGVLHKPFPEDKQEYRELVEKKLNRGDIPHPDRGGGQQADRFKYSIHTLEVSNMDTFAGNTLKFLSAQEFSKALMWKLQVYASSESGIRSLCDRFPRIFSHPIDKDVLDERRIAALRTSREGLDAKVKGMNGKEYQARELFNELLSFVNEPVPELGFYGLPFNVLHELIKSSELPTSDDFANYKDKNGVPSVYGYYKSGRGTAAHWMKARANALVADGMSEEDAVKNCLVDLGKSYHKHLKEVSGRDIENLFSSYLEP